MSDDTFGMALLWPRYISKPTERTLCYFHQGLLITEYGVMYEPDDFSDFVNYLFGNNVLCFVQQVQTFPYLEQAVPLSDTFCTSKGDAIAIRFTGQGRSTRWIVSAAAWGQTVPTLPWLQTLREAMTHAAVGTPNTAGAMGQALMRKAWRDEWGLYEWKLHRHQRPSAPACRVMQETRIGARCDVTDTSKEYEQALEIDMKNAYAAASCLLPTGQCYTILAGCVEQMNMYYVKCKITIHQELVLGPFPLRIEKDGTQENAYPREPGTYEAWLWHNEVELCRSSGCTVDIINGYGWKKTTDDMSVWVRLMERLRDTAPTPEIARIMKLAIVGGLGRFGMPDVMYSLLSESQRVRGNKHASDRLAAGNYGVVYDWWVRATIDESPQTMPHWYGWILACLRGWLYEAALPYAQQERLISTNTDGMIVLPNDEMCLLPTSIPSHTGDFVVRHLFHVKTPEKRHLFAFDETGKLIKKQPGKKRDGP